MTGCCVVVVVVVHDSQDSIGGEPMSTGTTGAGGSAGIEGMDGTVGKPFPAPSALHQGNVAGGSHWKEPPPNCGLPPPKQFPRKLVLKYVLR